MKKIIALCAVLCINGFINGNGYPAQQGYQAQQEHTHHGHHHYDTIADEADQRRLVTLDEQDADANGYVKVSRAGLVVGGSLVALGILTDRPASKLAIAGGIATFGLSATSGWLLYKSGQGRVQERKEILERRAKNNHH